MKVRALKTYQTMHIKDKELGRKPAEGEVFEVSEERYKILSGDNALGLVFVEKVETAAKKVKVEKAVKETTKTRKNAKK